MTTPEPCIQRDLVFSRKDPFGLFYRKLTMRKSLAERVRVFQMNDQLRAKEKVNPMVFILRVRTPGKWSITCIGDLYDIVWGDGTLFDPKKEYVLENRMTYSNKEEYAPEIGTVTHNFTDPGYYKVQLFGRLLEFGFAQAWLRSYIKSMDLIACTSFGSHPLLNLQGFHGNPYLETVPRDLPRSVRNLDHAFRDCTYFNCPNVRFWDVSNVTSLTQTFRNAKAFNQDIGQWDVSNVTTLEGTFMCAHTFDQDLDDWDTSSVERMDFAFSGALRFNGNIRSWNTTKVRDMSYMFTDTEQFNSFIGDWDTSSVRNMHAMFFRAKAFDQDISRWNTRCVVNMNGMFSHASSFNQDIRGWDTQSLVTAGYMFQDATRFRYNLDGWRSPRLLVPSKPF